MSDSYQNSFIDLCTNGELLPDDIDDFIDEWHESNSDKELYKYLGMTHQEYKMWIHDSEFLPFIITSRIQNRSIDAIINDQYDLPMAARADSPENAKLIMEWLKDSGLLN